MEDEEENVLAPNLSEDGYCPICGEILPVDLYCDECNIQWYRQ